MNRQRRGMPFAYRPRHFDVQRPAAAAAAGQERESHLSLKRVNELLEKQNDEILLGIVNPGFNFGQYLEAARMGDDMVNSLVELIAKALSCNAMRAQVTKLVPQIAQSNFLTKIVYLALEKRTATGNQYNVKLIRSVIQILRVVFESNQKQFEKVAPLKDRIEVLVKVRINDQELTNEFDESVRYMDRLTAKQNERERYRTFKNTDVSNALVDVDPPEHFVEMNIIPKLSDIGNDQQPYLRKNITNGAYRSVSHYLDVQFRLLREDFLCPLREGVVELKKILVESGNARQKYLYTLPPAVTRKMYGIDDMHVYTCVTIVSCDYTADGVVYSLKMHDMKKMNWERSKRLIYGSLICLSSDVFESNCIIGVVCNREIEDLKKGMISVRFDYDAANGGGQGSSLPNFDETYVMLETTAYFESYRHVLDSLVAFERLGEEVFPFREQLVYCQNAEIPRPAYLNGKQLDFRPLVDKGQKIVHAEPEDFADRHKFTAESDYAKSCPAWDEKSWPTAQQMGLNESQYDAFKLALTNKLALIQGPPGTGKTYVGVKLVQLLLHNRDLWWVMPNRGEDNRNRHRLARHKPILMICYTNHALDQFLEHCIRECKIDHGVVRIGGQCKTESLEPFLLRNVKSNLSKQNRGADNYFAVRAEKDNIERIQQQLQQTNFLLANLNAGILNSSQFSELLSKLGIFSYEIQSDAKLLAWLGFNLNSQNEADLSGWFDSKMNLDAPPARQRAPVFDQLAQPDQDKQASDEEDFIADENAERMLEDDMQRRNQVKLSKTTQEKWDMMKRHAFQQAFNDADGILKFDQAIKNQEYQQQLRRVRQLTRKLSDDQETRERQEEQWQTQEDNKSKRRKFNKTKNLIAIITTATDQDISQEDFMASWNGRVKNLGDLSVKERHQLYRIVLAEYQMELLAKRNEYEQEFNTSVTNLKDLRMQEDRAVMQNALIVAMTTTGAARYHNIIKDIGPPIVIVEEAAEVFEAHIVSSLSKDCQHLILIGDHVQLRPNPTVYKLAQNFKIDVSLFERLLNNNMQKVMLKCQHRMRPEISQFMAHFYRDQITDSASVHQYPSVVGLKKNMFYIKHSQPESKSNEDKSKSNTFEARYIAKMCQYLRKQNYQEPAITVLTMYLGQLIEVRKHLKTLGLNAVRVCTVDNYQGEENDIIILSLVRSNDRDEIGFLKIENRICVALSRARHGFYCIGNLEMLQKCNRTWGRIIETAEKTESCGVGLVLSCGKHPANDTLAIEPTDFDLRPSGGCKLPCNYRLTCGHVCKLFCHTYDADHVKYECKEVCNNVIEKCGHYCKKTCGHAKSCEAECLTLVEKKIVECGHTARLRCHQEPVKKYCTHPCDQILPCGHKCSKLCNQPCGPCCPSEHGVQAPGQAECPLQREGLQVPNSMPPALQRPPRMRPRVRQHLRKLLEWQDPRRLQPEVREAAHLRPHLQVRLRRTVSTVPRTVSQQMRALRVSAQMLPGVRTVQGEMPLEVQASGLYQAVPRAVRPRSVQ